MGSEGGFHHRSTLKQQNKPFKSRHATKGQLRAKTKGKVDVEVSVKHKHKLASKKADRRNQAKLIQQRKRREITNLNRFFSGANGAPKIVAVVPLCPDVDPHVAIHDLYASVGQSYIAHEGPSVLSVDRFKQKLQFIPLRRHLLDILDALKVADFVLFVMSAEVEVDSFGELCLTTIKAQGVPSIVNIVQHLENFPAKKQIDIRKSLISFMSYHFPDDPKLFHATCENEGVAALRHIIQQTPKSILWRDRHAYMLAENLDYNPHEGDESIGTLQVTGYIRGSNLSANRLVHIPNYGDFQIEMIASAAQAISSADRMTIDSEILDIPVPDQQESLIAENEPDPMDGEQTWPTEEELRNAEERVERLMSGSKTQSVRKRRRVPVGTSSYQAAWIIDDEDDVEFDDDGSEPGDDNAMLMDDEMNISSIHPDVITSENDYKSMGEAVDPDGEEEEYQDLQDAVLEDMHADERDYDEVEEDRQYREYLDKQRKERDDLDFPDELDTPRDVPARVRFQRYRGLKSFRTSPWDPYESLPPNYARIFQFQNFKRTKKRVLEGVGRNGVSPGTYVTIYIRNVPRSVVDERKPGKPTVIFSLLPHEHKYSILNFSVTRHAEFTEPVRSKDPMVLHCGFRRYIVRPIYSTHTRGGTNNVHKFERFLQPGRSAIATIYAPIQFGPAPVMMFRYTEHHTTWDPAALPSFVGQGMIMDLDPCRIVAKRFVLTGHPFKVHKRGAVIRYMFWNPEDINYFKPVQLVTKLGRVGHIRESLGTHGYMKCIFDGPLQGQDTVCMQLYKRVFPKWTTALLREGSVDGSTEMVE